MNSELDEELMPDRPSSIRSNRYGSSRFESALKLLPDGEFSTNSLDEHAFLQVVMEVAIFINPFLGL